jgi:hypothetical protein
MLTLSPETESLIKARAAATGKTPDEIIREALIGDARHPPHPDEPINGAKRDRPDLAGMRDIARRVAQRPLLDNRGEKEICDEGWGE